MKYIIDQHYGHETTFTSANFHRRQDDVFGFTGKMSGSKVGIADKRRKGIQTGALFFERI